MSELHFNVLPAAEATERLLTCLAVPRWAADVVDGRPYADLAALTKQAEAAAAALTDDEVAAALARHPRIGERAGTGHDAAFSAREQAAVVPSAELVERDDAALSAREQAAVVPSAELVERDDAALSAREQAAVVPSAELVAGNREYERRFGRVFLIRAAGRTAPEILAELRRRLDNDEATERAETVAQLREIALLRLPEVVGA